MAIVLNRATFQFKQSVNTPDYPIEDWVINPDLSGVIGILNQYWKLSGDIVSEMSQAEKDAVDLANSEASKDTTAGKIDTDDYLKAFALIMLDEINILRSQHSLPLRTAQQLKTALRGKL